MAEAKLILITGRSTRQGVGISAGKELDEYRTATGVVQLCPADMLRFGLHDDDPVVLKSAHGTAAVKCRAADLPEGLAFIAFGPPANQLIGGETQGSGMPDSKGFTVTLAPAPEIAPPQG